ncbi:MAG: hypothetical protein OXT67_09615 [Zetaproteobacteria bacterium]|nr:hypothetical protein [Zetaproteobacteria bacterium]
MLRYPETGQWFDQSEIAYSKILAATVGHYENFTSYAQGQASVAPAPDSRKELQLSNLCFAGDWVKLDFSGCFNAKSSRQRAGRGKQHFIAR